MVKEGLRPMNLFPDHTEDRKGTLLRAVQVRYYRENEQFVISIGINADKTSPNPAYE